MNWMKPSAVMPALEAAAWNDMAQFDENNYDESYYKRLSRMQVLVTVGLIGGPISILIGGVPLSLAALICSVIAFFSLRGLNVSGDDIEPMARRLYIQSIVACGMCIITLTLNMIFFIDLFIQMLDAYKSGNLDSFLNAYLYGSQSSSSDSIWNH